MNVNNEAIMSVETVVTSRPNGKKQWKKVANMKCPNCGIEHKRLKALVGKVGKGVYCSKACRDSHRPVNNHWMFDAYFEDYGSFAPVPRKGVKVYGIRTDEFDLPNEPIDIHGI